MKNLFFTAIAMIAFSFAGNATNSVKSTSSKSPIAAKDNTLTTIGIKTRIINSTNLLEEDGCSWVTTKTTVVYYADGSVGRIVHQKWVCV